MLLSSINNLFKLADNGVVECDPTDSIIAGLRADGLIELEFGGPCDPVLARLVVSVEELRMWCDAGRDETHEAIGREVLERKGARVFRARQYVDQI